MAAVKSEKVRVPPEAIQVPFLDEIAGRLGELTEVQQKILKHMEETTPEGVDFPISEVTVTESNYVNFVKEFPYQRIRKIDFFNKGPNTVYVRVNEEKEFSIEDKEQMSVVKPRAIIEHVTMRVTLGESAVVRRWGHY